MGRHSLTKGVVSHPGSVLTAVLCVAFSVDGSKLATGSAASVIDLFDARSWKRLGQCEGHMGAVTHLDWSRDGRWLMSNSSELELMYWVL